MDGGIAGRAFRNRIDVHPSRHDRCAECDDAVGGEWVSYRQDSGNPQRVIKHFGGIIQAGPIEPRPERPNRAIRDFRYPEDLEVFFHPWCAPGVKLPEKLEQEIAELLAKAIIADYEKTLERWAKVGG